MDRLIFGRKSLNFPRSRDDRFIAPREFCDEMRRRRSFFDEKQPVDIWYPNHLQQKKYTVSLDKAFGLDFEQRNDSLKLWPCRPRKQSYLCSADSVLDLPTYSYAPFPELLDWSSDNILVAALGRKYHRWSWRTQKVVNRGLTYYNVHCCKFDPRGQYLLLGTDMSRVEIHNNKHTKWVNDSICVCITRAGGFCSVTALDWSPTGNSYVTGCSRGQIMSFSRDAKKISLYSGNSAVFLLRVSPDARYVAAATVNSDVINIFVWPALHKFWTIYGKCITKLNGKHYFHRPLKSQESNYIPPKQTHPMFLKDGLQIVGTLVGHLLMLHLSTIAWHPWRSALLGVGNDSVRDHARIALLDVPSAKLDISKVGQSHHQLDVMLFSHRTGELVMSLRNIKHSLEFPQRELVVMSDPATVVDRWQEDRSGLQGVRTMVFSPDGTKLATATADEDLIIWNFLPEDNKKKTKNNRLSALPVYLDQVTNGYSVR